MRWERKNPCGLDDRSSCPKRKPTQLAAREVSTMRQMVTGLDYRHMSIRALALHAHRRESSTQSPRSAFVNRGRLTDRFRTPSCWRSAKTSMASCRRVLTKASAAKSKDRMRFSTAAEPAPARIQSQ